MKTEDFKLRYSSFYLNLRTNQKEALLFTALYLYRRLVLSVVVTMLPGAPLAQMFIVLYSSLGMSAYLLGQRPHKSKNTRAFELYNELTILSVTYVLMMNADLVTDDMLRYNIGWALVGVIGINIIANIINVVISMIKKIRLVVKRL